MKTIHPIAIVGIGGVFPNAPGVGISDTDASDMSDSNIAAPDSNIQGMGVSDINGFWEIIRQGISTVRQVPQGRWPLSTEKAYDPIKGSPDKVYSTKACFIDEFRSHLIPDNLNINRSFLNELDPLFHLLLVAGGRAFNNAVTENLDPARVGVIIGNIVLPSKKASAMAIDFLGQTFAEKVLGHPGMENGVKTHPINRYVAGLPAGILAKALGLGNGSFTLDAACASSLYALKLASDKLLTGQADAMLTGGLSRPDCLYTQMGFSQLRALSASGICSPFDAKADGLVVGEGAGIFVLKRTEDAVRDGDHIYAVISGIGLSNDVGGSLLAPNSEGQIRAMTPAYEQAGWSPQDVDLIECHATGTPVGDTVEFKSLKSLWGASGWTPGQCIIGSVKSNIGHLLTAAGSAALMKVLLALRNKTLPPTANFRSPHPDLGMDAGPFRVLMDSRPWNKRTKHTPRRAAISAFGFGGINAHVLIEEWDSGLSMDACRPMLENLRTKRSKTKKQHTEIAIVGMDASFGPWNSLDKFRERVLGNPATKAPATKLKWWGAENSAWFKKQGLDRFPFSGFTLNKLSVPLNRFRIPPKELEQMLPQQSIILQVADKAIQDAKLPEAGRLRTGVFIGIGLDLNTSNFQLRWWLPKKAEEWAETLGLALSEQEREQWIAALRKAMGPALTANRTMGALGGIVASRIAREFHFGGPGFTLSSEESSGISALETAVHLLRNKTIDHALVGAVDMAGDIRSVLGAHFGRPFSVTGRTLPFRPDADGTIVGQGAAAVILKRLDQAVSHNNRIYAVIRGIGTASGGGVETYVPDAQAFISASHKACKDAGIEPGAIGYVETHGSGCPEEDNMEIKALQALFPSKDNNFSRPFGTVKADIGHTGAASGMASFIKLCLCLDQKILPPVRYPDKTIKTQIPNTDCFSPVQSQYWMRNRIKGPRRAALNCFSMDGNCSQVILEAYEKHADHPIDIQATQPLGAKGVELFAIEGDQVSEILSGLEQLRSQLSDFQEPDLEALAKKWYRQHPLNPNKNLCLTITPQSIDEMLHAVDSAKNVLKDNPRASLTPMPNLPLSFSPYPLGKNGQVAFVFPGSGNHFPGMGQKISARWPEIFNRQDQQNECLKGQFLPEIFWNTVSIDPDKMNPSAAILGQVTLGTLMCDLIRDFGVTPGAAIGYSLGESTALFSLKAWTQRDEMLRRINESTLFTNALAGTCQAARNTWNSPENEEIEWVSGVVDCPEKDVKKALKGREKVYLLIVNTLNECVVGGNRKEVEMLVDTLGCRFFPLSQVTTVHCEVAKQVAKPYHDLHVFEVTPPPDIRFYSCAWARPYQITSQNAANSILEQALNTIHFPKVINRSYEEGTRIYLEMGPGNSCTRMIGNILAGQPHMAVSACYPGQDEVLTVLRLLGQLLSERVPVDLNSLFNKVPSLEGVSQDRQAPSKIIPAIIIPVGGEPFKVPRPKIREAKIEQGKRTLAQQSKGPVGRIPRPNAQMHGAARTGQQEEQTLLVARSMEPVLHRMEASDTARAQAHEEYLRFTQDLTRTMSRNLSFQMTLINALKGMPNDIPEQEPDPPMAFDRRMCMEFAIGSIEKVLGPQFSAIDLHPTRVRLPDEPLMLVDRILSVEGLPGSLSNGRVITEHDIIHKAWYLDNGRIPTCIAVEAGQADLFLSGFLGIDFKTKGLAVYRLLDALVTFHSELPGSGTTIRYDIRIDEFFQQGDSHLFRFNFESTVNGKPLLSMTNGCAGFFTTGQLDAGKGIVHTELDRRPMQGIRPDDWQDFVPMDIESYDDHQIHALRSGDIEGCFGPLFSGLNLKHPLTIPGGKMALVDRVLHLDPKGGRFGLGMIRGEADIHPDDWFLTCHFVDDQVMPGTLMYECCLHTLRIFLLRMGWIGEKDKVACDPVPNIAGQLKCRGQVIKTTQKATYEVSIKELGYLPEPYAIVDALMYADGKPIVEITNMSIRFTGLDKKSIQEIWDQRKPTSGGENTKPRPIYDHDRILAFAVGKPSDAFGKPYEIFDHDRVIARLPGPPYQFLDRITAIDAEQWQCKAGGVIEAQYDVPPDAWYFKACGMPDKPEMPFAVLLEVALQPCGWMAAFIGSALTSDIDLCFRNLGGTAVQYEPVFPNAGTLTSTVKITNISTSAGMIIQNYDFDVRNQGRPVYKGDTYFGFFTRQALADQVGIRDVSPYEPSSDEINAGLEFDYPTGLLFPKAQLKMLDRIDLYVPDGGPNGLGFIRGVKDVDPEEWFFKAHFYQDPVCPGSLGLESFLQLMKVVAVNRWGAGEWKKDSDLQGKKSIIKNLTMVPGNKHVWLYRGQVLPTDKQVTVQAVVTAFDDNIRQLKADGFLMVDGRIIYRMNDFKIMAR